MTAVDVLQLDSWEQLRRAFLHALDDQGLILPRPVLLAVVDAVVDNLRGDDVQLVQGVTS